MSFTSPLIINLQEEIDQSLFDPFKTEILDKEGELQGRKITLKKHAQDSIELSQQIIKEGYNLRKSAGEGIGFLVEVYTNLSSDPTESEKKEAALKVLQELVEIEPLIRDLLEEELFKRHLTAVLFSAIEEGDSKKVAYCLKAGAFKEAKNAEGKTPFMVAQELNNMAILTLFKPDQEKVTLELIDK